MKILMIDRSGFQLQTRHMVLEEEAECIVENASTLGEVFIAYQKGLYDIVVIDHAIENGLQCVNYILQIDPSQSILVVSDAIHCVVKRCEDCVNTYQIRRLFNPTPIHDIVRMVKGFSDYECDHYDRETNRIQNED